MVHPFLLRVLKFRVWVVEMLRPNELQITLFWAGLVGFFGGLISFAFRKGIQAAQWLFTHQTGSPEQIAAALPWWQRLLIPTLGGLAAGIVIHAGFKLFKGQSSTDYMEAISLGEGVIRTRSTLVKSFSSLLTIASGGSIGREGPMVQLSAMFGSLIGRRGNFTPIRLQLLVACGASAGIASAYNAPIAGALFVAEIVIGSIAMESFGPLIFSSVVATVTVRHLLGGKPVFEIPAFKLVSNWELIPYLLLGLFTGFFAPWFMRLLRASETLFARIETPIYFRLALGGLIVGLLSLLRPEVWGNGYDAVDSILHGQVLPHVLVLILVTKVLATASTVGSGAVGGVFTPTLFVGAVLGALLGGPFHTFWPHATASPSAYALVGMGCFLAATTHAPLMAILMLFEMTLDYAIVLPLMIAGVTAYYTSQGFEKKSIYADVLRRKTPPVPESPLATLKVSDLLKPDPICVFEKSRFDEIAQTFAANRYNYLYVIGPERRFLGSISLHDIKSFLSDPDLAKLVIASDFLKENFPFITPEARLGEALEKFSQHDGERLPVVNNPAERKLIGAIAKTDLLLTLAHGVKSPAAAAKFVEPNNSTSRR